MSANIHQYAGRRDAWHQLGKVLGKHFNWSDLERENILQFDVFKSQLRDGLGRPVEAYGTFRWDKSLNRTPADAVFLGTVGKDYAIVPHRNGFHLIDALIGATNGAHYETAGALGNGEVVWALADLNLGFSIGDDKTESYLLFYTSYDGSYKHTYRLTNTRVVCQNTLSAAISSKTAAQFAIRHTKNALPRVIEAHKALNSLSADVKTVEEKLRFLASKRITRESATALFDRLFPKKEATSDAGVVEVSTKRRDNIIAAILEKYEFNDGDAFPEQRGTAYNLLNAVTNWVDHDRGSDSGKRVLSATFGTGDELKNTALGFLLKSAETLPATSTAPVISLAPTATAVLEPEAPLDPIGASDVALDPEANDFIDDVVRRTLEL